MDQAAIYSRPLAAAAALGADAEDHHRFLDKKVLLTGEESLLQTVNGAEIARAALLLLIRISADVTVGLPAACGELRAELEAAVRRLAPKMTVRFLDEEPGLRSYDAILSVGTRARDDMRSTVINSNGWTARVSSGGQSLSAECNQANPVGALAAACLGVAEVFKRLIRLRPSKGELLDGISYSLWTYRAGDEDPGPELPNEMPVSLLLAGAGAIGNGTAYLISRLPIAGSVTVVDKQVYGPENWGTSICIGADDIGEGKAKVLAFLLPDRLKPQPRHAELAAVGAELGGALPYPAIVLGGLDNIDARHEIQKLWPDLVIDGAIGSDFSCQASCHPWGEDVACLVCLFVHARSGERAEVVASRATGLPEDVCRDPDAIITEEHVQAAPAEKRPWLSQQVGRRICSVTPEAVARLLSEEVQRDGFTPSVPFVACYSSCMVVTELVRYLMTGRTSLEPRYQLNLLWGPQRGSDYPQARRHNCMCVERGHNIERVRASRSK